ncbi:hypothetical protein SBF1_4510004 [Candidatus Desulfosporosinus infrequens]|uniref:Uncharacterized protein n=1 Tax=Candidatus Desulfosporosinus infrequens TaxID=2043169 RepID=A0A2U3LC59_9FIRM|nr:hypothetical protein SBF1_4510004 [Candidatus Desulfosporosinus infrequens]
MQTTQAEYLDQYIDFKGRVVKEGSSALLNRLSELLCSHIIRKFYHGPPLR